MGLAIKNSDQLYTYKDYLTWNNPAERWVLINGVAYDKSPASLRQHQSISSELHGVILSL